MVAIRQWTDVLAISRMGSFESGILLDLNALGSPIPDPGAIYGISANFPDFVEAKPAVPTIFMKSPTSVVGPFDEICLPGLPNYDQVAPYVTWEAELGVVIGKRAHCIADADAADVIAGFCVAQDLTERRIQSPPGSKHPEFVAAKSYPGFCPLGPWITPWEQVSPSELRIVCKRNGDLLQDADMSTAIFSVAEAVAYLSAITILRPGDVLLMGTPPTVEEGAAELKAGDVLETEIGELGRMRNPILGARIGSP